MFVCILSISFKFRALFVFCEFLGRRNTFGWFYLSWIKHRFFKRHRPATKIDYNWVMDLLVGVHFSWQAQCGLLRDVMSCGVISRVMFCHMVRCDLMWCGVMYCHMVWSDVMSCDLISSDAMGWDVVIFNVVGCEDMWCDATWFCDVLNWEMMCWEPTAKPLRHPFQ